MPPSFFKYASLTQVPEEVLQNYALVFDVEEALFKSTSMFPFFFLVAFEGGGLLRALILLILYPFLCIIGKRMRMKVMVFICFFGIKTKTFRIGRSVLPKFFLENVGHEGLEMVMKFGRRVGVSNLPRVMVEGFLVDYLGFQDIVASETKSFGGYYLGMLENSDRKKGKLKQILANVESEVLGLSGATMKYPFTYCKDIYLASKEDRKHWRNLRREKYPKPLVFHDGRLAFEPTPLATFVMLMWLPFGVILSMIRVLVGILLPYSISASVLAFIGVSYTASSPKPFLSKKPQGLVYVCNHKTVLDPVFISLVLQRQVMALTYSISRLTAFLAPFRTLNLTRDKEKDAEIMRDALSKGNLVVCPEGTTCREPYLLRFSPLFAEISDNIVPVAVQVQVSMFYGTTASGIKALDPFVVLMNPLPRYHIKFLEKLPKSHTCNGGGMMKYDVANYVQAEIGKALGYKCTDLTRRDKYVMLAGKNGLVS